MSYPRHSKSSIKDEIQSTVNSIDQSQLAAANNRIDVDKEAQDLNPETYVKSRGTNLSLNEPLIHHSTEAPLPECARFSRPVKKIEIEKE